MITLVALALLAIGYGVAAAYVVRDDRPRELPRSRFVPPDLRPPADNDRQGLAVQHWARERPR